MRQVVLASKSPRRQELLKQITTNFIIDVCEKPEKKPLFVSSIKVPQFLAKQKVKDVYKRHKDCVVIGADTVVIANNQILGKPKDRDDVRRMITMLSDNTHLVVTGVYIKCKEYSKGFSSITKVTFRKMSEEEIEEYCKLDTIYDKAGAYAIQSEAKEYIVNIEGDYNNVVGLPVDELKEYLK